MSSESTQEFSRFRSFLWPIHRHELKKLLPMLAIFFLISFSYNVLRTMKDTLIITAKSSGAEVIPFIKVWVMFPGAILMTFFFTRMSNRLNREGVFYGMMSIFLLYFFIFTFFLYPHRESLHLHGFADSLQAVLPAGCKGLIAMIRYWSFTCFYAMSELWGNIILFLLFWGFANQVTRLSEAKRFYALFGVGANLSGIFAGQISVYCCRMDFMPYFPFGHTAWDQTLVILISLILLSGLVVMALFRWVNTAVLSDPRFTPDHAEESQEVRGKMSMRDNFRHLFRSKYLLLIASIVLTYNLVINLVEVLWKQEVHALYPSAGDYNLYMNQVSTVIGIIATITALFVSGNVVRRFGWTKTALITPVILFITSISFFGMFFMKGSLTEISWTLWGGTPLVWVVFLGTLQNCCSRAAKYTVYDVTKEMAFIPLAPDLKVKGKAAIDGVCTRLGKSGGSVIHQGLLITFTTITASAPYVAGVLLAIISIWTVSTKALGKQFDALDQKEGFGKENDTPSKELNEELALQEPQAV